jgi:hypothetical protein
MTVAAVLATPVMAMPAPPVPEHGARAGSSLVFSELDRDNDGLITREELPPDHDLARKFAEYDLDGDQALSRSEFQRYLRGESETAAAQPEDDDAG